MSQWDQWEQHDAAVGPAGAEHLAATVTTDAVDVNATLLLRGGRWRVTTW